MAVGATVHDFVTVSAPPGEPNPSGDVTIDWFLNGTCTGAAAQTGGPFNITTNIATITGSATVRPDLIGALPALVKAANVDPATGAVTSYQWFASNTVCDPRIAAGAAGACTSSSIFALPYNAAGVAHFGNLGRNVLYGPGFGNTDFSVIKNVTLQGSVRVQLRLELLHAAERVLPVLPQ